MLALDCINANGFSGNGGGINERDLFQNLLIKLGVKSLIFTGLIDVIFLDLVYLLGAV